MSGQRRVRLILLVALLALIAFNYPALRIADQSGADAPSSVIVWLFAAWLVTIVLCALIVNWRRP